MHKFQVSDSTLTVFCCSTGLFQFHSALVGHADDGDDDYVLLLY